MSSSAPDRSLQMTSTLTAAGDLVLDLATVQTPAPGPDEVLIQIEATPVNPSDLGVLLGPADPARARREGARTVIPLSPAALKAASRRLGHTLTIGNEGAGLVIAAGDQARDLLGRRVALLGGGMYAQHRLAKAADCLVLPEGTTAAEGAAAFVNPLTVLAMIETMRLEGHTALVHTAAASNLGQMLVKVCAEDQIPLVNVVRRPEQAELLRGLGAEHVCDSSAPGFDDDLRAAVAATAATLAFDAIGGGRIASQILAAMEAAATARMTDFSVYGSIERKQVYIYGVLDTGPTELLRNFGMTWNVGGWLMPPILMRLGPERAAQLRQRVLAGLKTVFASHYSREISLAELLEPEVLLASTRKATGEKLLINPTR
ncbi:NADH oxidase [Phenylobacterium sp. LjRoot219]|uniref:alcohol dehydrogenase catalytic domain-containing protein n=1 Tax=Phenylobacterium sp. LjRoot219 TaxID=3342283 RepID=UPI003ECDAD61